MDVLDPLELTHAAQRVQARIEDVYGIRVMTCDVPDPLTGDLDGVEIHVDYEVEPELRLFLLAHLFGHTVQWNCDPRALELGRPHKPPVPEELLPAILEYESEAARYSMQLFHDTGIHDLDQWLSDFTATDLAYLSNYYRTGEKGDFRRFTRKADVVLTPLAIPAFTPSRHPSRMEGIVI